ncbi:hypothetical protein QMK17_13340 [Rhodococcus sp. G-MC3]|uniref:hypothetical protein n=1 Tax=Rhodococcus sp. G-MC3 TaxID=3046209 RepID=UPI0024B9BFE7|nr:hypothetical protein [Rhodococcus sp. G-MC3]MDJ0394311.1 hypothetical protein [Rhodococcus sp. G-MC3]
MAEARRLQVTPAHRSVARDLWDNLLVHLCAYSLGEAGPRSGLVELEMFGRAIERERAVRVQELNDKVGRHVIAVAENVTRESREQARSDMLLPLGAPSSGSWQAAINVFSRVIISRAVDGLIHPVFASQTLCRWPIPEPSNQPDVPGIHMIVSAKQLLDSWKDERGRRDVIEQQMMDTFRAGTWP